VTASQLNRQKEIESFAEAVLGGFRYDQVPVDVLLIARTENIILVPIRNSEPLFGRIEYHKNTKRFSLFHHDTGGSIIGEWQVRFSIAHELGHYYIPEHRHALMQGHAHSSVPGFICDVNLEREADIFASTLLIPSAPLEGVIGRNKLSFGKIESLAHHCNTSTVAAAVRASRASEETAITVLSKSRVLFAAASDEARALGFGWVERIPVGSATASIHSGKAADARVTSSRQWFPNTNHNINGWEEVCALGSSGLALTLLLFDDIEDED
jgi:Zn-dependent peptidase ImmA (M78 family)